MDRLYQNGFSCIEHSGEGTGLINLWENHERVLIIDAMRSNQPPGTIRLINANRQQIPTDLFHYSSHQFGLAQAVELAKTLNRLPTRLWILGIEGANFDYGEQLTPTVEDAMDEAMQQAIALMEQSG